MKKRLLTGKYLIILDLDGTLIPAKPFSKNNYSWEFIQPTINILKAWVENRGADRCFIGIATNQGGIELGFVNEHRFQEKLMDISRRLCEEISIDNNHCFGVYCPSNSSIDSFRKPNVGMLDYIVKHFRDNFPTFVFDKPGILYVGDASGRVGDFSDSDLKVANNYNVDYMDVRDLWEVL